jgi:opacity protein-like surface antigen
MIRKFVAVSASRAVVVMLLVRLLAGAQTVLAQQAPAAQSQPDSLQASQSQANPQAPQGPASLPQPGQSQADQSQADQSEASLSQANPSQTQQEQTQSQAPQSQPQTQSQPPADQSNQEATEEEAARQRRVKPRDFTNWSFNVGGGGSLTSGTTNEFARGGGGVAAVGVARNTSKYFGLRADVQFDNLPLVQSALRLAQAPSGSSYAIAATFDPIINVPVTKIWSFYVLFGPAFVHRGGKLSSSSVLQGGTCNGFWKWWGSCTAGSLPLDNNYLSTDQNQVGYNVGGGLARKVHGNIEIYGEFRIVHGSKEGITTDMRPATIGVRW